MTDLHVHVRCSGMLADWYDSILVIRDEHRPARTVVEARFSMLSFVVEGTPLLCRCFAPLSGTSTC